MEIQAILEVDSRLWCGVGAGINRQLFLGVEAGTDKQLVVSPSSHTSLKSCISFGAGRAGTNNQLFVDCTAIFSPVHRT